MPKSVPHGGPLVHGSVCPLERLFWFVAVVLVVIVAARAHRNPSNAADIDAEVDRCSPLSQTVTQAGKRAGRKLHEQRRQPPLPSAAPVLVLLGTGRRR